ncbi:thiamine-phosphate kinase [Actinomyces gaoshouyii]|uniref:Thiamine-monophosphate kinase n=1 Tax=Actinomyces gaoshouyii TaxID=1960083 RepID=A0A8H9HDK5_9ACTO|nr:thiamine-phosphate kinase [Actinomyces gaoshouyii]GGO99142.1 thiamine-monophosphate kinase [Actinomyces gaoshouyii]
MSTAEGPGARAPGLHGRDHAVLTVADLGEEGLLARFAPLLPRAAGEVVGTGDDCAVLAAPDGRYAVSTDVLVEGLHFRTDWSTPEQVGRRAAAQNLADAAAMGALPTALTVGLAIPGTTPVAWVEGMVAGMGEACRECGAGVVGGDLVGGRAIVISVTVLGDLQGRAPVLRSGARPGDAIVHVGAPGRSAAGLALLSAGIGDGDAPGPQRRGQKPAPAGSPRALDVAATRAEARACLEAFRAPRPPLEAGPVMARSGASAMMDVSDSLLRDGDRIARASGVILDIDEPGRGRGALASAMASLVPVARLLADDEAAAAAIARTWVLTGGEDHGMLATVPAEILGAPAGGTDGLPDGARVIGHVRAAGDGESPGVRVGGRVPETGFGWDHFGG